MIPIEELVEVDDPPWPALSERLREAEGRVVVMPVDENAGRECLHRLQVSARSTMGALALHTGGLLIDHGWLRILGGGADRLTDLATANSDELSSAAEGGVLNIGHDVLGGRFAINGGALEGEPGEVHFWAPDTLTWLPLGSGYSGFITWCLSGDLGSFYADLRWPGWADEIDLLAPDQGLSVWPPLCTAESRPISVTSRRAVPWTELASLLDELSGLPAGPVNFRVID